MVIFCRVKAVIIDEADKLFDDTFVSQMDGILAACDRDATQLALFSATMPPSPPSIFLCFTNLLRC
jgi:superfamily II DNA/RNA helicase